MIINISTKCFLIPPWYKYLLEENKPLYVYNIDNHLDGVDKNDPFAVYDAISDIHIPEEDNISFLCIQPPNQIRYDIILKNFIDLLNIDSDMFGCIENMNMQFNVIWDRMFEYDEKKRFDLGYVKQYCSKYDKEKNPVIREKDIPKIPLEYLWNMTELDEVKKKLDRFLLFDIILELKDYLMEYSDKNDMDKLTPLYAIATRMYISDTNPNRSVSDIFCKNPKNYIEELERLYSTIGLHTKFYPYDLEKYKATKTLMGYAKLGLFKFNRGLSDLIETTGYRLEVKKDDM